MEPFRAGVETQKVKYCIRPNYHTVRLVFFFFNITGKTSGKI